VLFYEDSKGSLAITQPAHAWLAAQLARNWGNDEFGDFVPFEPVCCGTEIHDIGMMASDTIPTLNPDTGKPHTFRELPLLDHVNGWMNASTLALAKGRYPALLTSLHGYRLYNGRYADDDSSDEAACVRYYLAIEEQFQKRMLQSLRADLYYAAHATDKAVQRNSDLVYSWDWMSLALLEGKPRKEEITNVPTNANPATITMTPLQNDPQTIAVSPWPFSAHSVTITCDARRFNQCYDNEQEMRTALAAAPWETISITLRPQ
jgi:hypothetical protein